VNEMKRELPKNVRQIGNVSDSSKIYIEDYVDTFFNQLCDKAEREMIGAFLVGETVQEEEQDYIYVYGAIRMKELNMKGKDFVVGEQVWKNACETCKEYFGDAEILGWFIAGGEHSLEVNHNINKIHQKYFPREKSIFVTKNARDKEEKFYIYKYKDLMECGGHYIYYEKNIEMQNYMIASRKKVGLISTEIIEDRVAKSFRNLIHEKAEKNEQKNHSRMVYALSTLLVLVILVVGVTMINNYDKMQKVQDSLNIGENESEDKRVETLGTIVQPQKDETDKEDEKQDEIQEEIKQDETQTDDGNVTDEQAESPKVDGEQEPDTSQSTPLTAKGEYIVKKGDTLEIISRANYGDGSYVKKICELNDLEDGNLIYIGQKLLLP